jgi:hypothetical protein
MTVTADGGKASNEFNLLRAAVLRIDIKDRL